MFSLTYSSDTSKKLCCSSIELCSLLGPHSSMMEGVSLARGEYGGSCGSLVPEHSLLLVWGPWDQHYKKEWDTFTSKYRINYISSV